MLSKLWIILGFLSAHYNTKFILIETDDINENKTATEDENVYGKDYMNSAGSTQHVNVGDAYDIKCNSPKEIKKCSFIANSGNTIFKVKSGATFDQNRIQCLCDVSI